MHLKILSPLAAVLLLAACETAPKESASTQGAGATVIQAPTQQAAVPVGVVPGSEEDLRINVGDRIFFDFDKSNLKPEAQAQVERWAAWLQQYPQNGANIEGHCDERGTREYNLALGERRANATMEYLVSLGISPNRVTIISYGKERPAVLGSGDAVWAQNRRSVLRVN